MTHVLYGKRIKLRKLLNTDQMDIYHHIQDEEIRINTPLALPFSLSDVQDYIEKANLNQNHQQFGIEHYDSEQVIGVVSIYNIHSEKPFVGYWISKSYRQMGLSKEALQLILAFNLEKLFLPLIYATVLDRNIASIKVLTSSGFKYSHSSEDLQKNNGKNHQIMHYCLDLTGLIPNDLS
ncbi:GNAT family N-acetyltransferase [bacterium]|nr:GNAT family N-acetyltransferase [bacterium]